MLMLMLMDSVMLAGESEVVNKVVGGSVGRLDEGVSPFPSPSSPVSYWLAKRSPPSRWVGEGLR